MKSACSKYNTSSIFRYFPALLLCLLLPLQVIAQSGDPIGRVLQTAGTVVAIDADNNTRELVRRSDIHLGDTVVTGAKGFIQIRLLDGAMLSLQQESEFRFDEFDYDGDPNTNDSVVMNLLQGGFRTISGSIGDSTDDKYRVDTNFASIGVRGTTHRAVISFGTLFTAVSDGGTTVSNELGSVDTGLGAAVDYSATTNGQAPVPLFVEPPEIEVVK